ncbi:MAG: hypothetical protein ABH804_02830 [archaeon]
MMEDKKQEVYAGELIKEYKRGLLKLVLPEGFDLLSGHHAFEKFLQKRNIPYEPICSPPVKINHSPPSIICLEDVEIIYPPSFERAKGLLGEGAEIYKKGMLAFSNWIKNYTESEKERYFLQEVLEILTSNNGRASSRMFSLTEDFINDVSKRLTF